MTGTSLTLRLVRVYLGKQQMDVVFDDPRSEKSRLVKYTWKTKDLTDEPPANWYSAVLGEVKYQRGRDLKRRTGRLLPGE